MKKFHIQENSVQETLVIPLYGRVVAHRKFPNLINDPTAEEIALGIGDTEESVKKALLYNNGVISLNNNYTDDRDTELGEIVSDGFNLESEVLKKEQLHCLKECLKKLSDEEKEIITLRFFNNYKISQIERLLGIPRTRINKILDTSLNKMKLLLVGKVS